MIDVSIIIVNYNRLDLTIACIQSIVQKTVDLAYEIIVVDNASDTLDATEIKVKFPAIKFIRSKVNTGFAGGNNLGLAAADGDYILLLNNDTLLKNNAIKIVHSFLKTNERVGVAAAQLRYPDGSIQHSCQRFPSFWYTLLELLRLQKILGHRLGGRLLLGPFFDHQSFAYPDWVWGTFFMFPKHILSRFPAGRLHETFFMYWEDVQWCKEIRKLGYKVAYIPEAEVVHLMNASGGPKNKLIEENEALFMRQYYAPFHRTAIGLISKLLNRTID
jgi:GT2 family glycosyltransferase